MRGSRVDNDTLRTADYFICSPFKRRRSQTEKSEMPREPPHRNFEARERTTLKEARGVLKKIRLT